MIAGAAGMIVAMTVATTAGIVVTAATTAVLMIGVVGIAMIAGAAGMIVATTAVTTAGIAATAVRATGVAETEVTGKARPKRPPSKTTSRLSYATSSVTSGPAEARIAEAAVGAATGIALLANPARGFTFPAGLPPLGPITSRPCFG